EIKIEAQVANGSVEKVISGAPQRIEGMIQVQGRYGPGDFRNFLKWQGNAESKLNIPDFLSLKASGSYKGEMLDVDYDLDAKDLQRVSSFLTSWQGRGLLASRGTVKGKWPDLVWEGSISSPTFEYGPVKGDQSSLSGKGKIWGKEAARKLSFKTQNLAVGGNQMGSFHLELEQQNELFRFQSSGEQPRNRLTTKLSGRVEQMWTPPQRLTISQGELTWKDQTGSLDARLELHKERVLVQSLIIQQQKQKVRLTGELALDAKSDLRLNLENINTGQWLNLAGFGELLAGNATGEVHVTGRAEQPEVSLKVSLTNGAFNPGGLPQAKETKGQELKSGSASSKGRNRTPSSPAKEPIERLQLKGAYAGNILEIDGELQAQPDLPPARLAARLPVHFSLKPFRMEVNKTEALSSSFKVGGVRVERLLPYLPFLDKAAGLIAVDVHASGTWSQPTIRGTGFFHDGHFQVGKWPHLVSDIQVEWQADSKDIFITKGDVKLLGADVKVTGRVDYPHFEVMEFEAEGKGLDIPDVFGVTGKASGRARLVQDSKGAHITGDLQVSKAVMNLGDFETDLAKNIDIVDGDNKGDILVIRGDENRQDNYYNRMKMNLAIELPQSGTWVRGKGLNAEIVGSLKIEKDPFGSLRFLGGFQTLRGTYTFQGTELKITDGELVFLGSASLDPHLKIVCQKEVRDVMIQVQATGPVSQPKLALSSLPAMNQVDALSYLLFGHPATELSSKESSLLQDRAASWVGSQTSNVLKGVFGKSRFAPDTLQYRTSTDRQRERSSSTPTSNEQVGIIEIGKYITPDLYVTYGQGIKGEKENQVKLEYRFKRHISVETQIG
ncbi:MAG: translocation/assembly module TamB, partial [Deltaproteobacteria bacterium]